MFGGLAGGTAANATIAIAKRDKRSGGIVAAVRIEASGPRRDVTGSLNSSWSRMGPRRQLLRPSRGSRPNAMKVVRNARNSSGATSGHDPSIAVKAEAAVIGTTGAVRRVTDPGRNSDRGRRATRDQIPTLRSRRLAH